MSEGRGTSYPRRNFRLLSSHFLSFLLRGLCLCLTTCNIRWQLNGRFSALELKNARGARPVFYIYIRLLMLEVLTLFGF